MQLATGDDRTATQNTLSTPEPQTVQHPSYALPPPPLPSTLPGNHRLARARVSRAPRVSPPRNNHKKTPHATQPTRHRLQPTSSHNFTPPTAPSPDPPYSTRLLFFSDAAFATRITCPPANNIAPFLWPNKCAGYLKRLNPEDFFFTITTNKTCCRFVL